MYPTPIQTISKPARASYKLALWSVTIIWLLPIIAVLLTSVRSLEDIVHGNYWGIPTNWQIVENYSAVFNTTPMLGYLRNSLLITIPVTLGTVMLSSLAGFALAKYKFKANIFIFAILIGGNFVPFQILMIPVRDLTITLGIYDTIWALIIFQTSFQIGFCTLFMRNFIITLPDALFDSARIEGVGEWKIFRQIVVPLMRPALAALSVLVFTFVWNDYFWALILVQSDEVRPVTAGLSSLKGQWVASWHMISAGSIAAALPPVILFFMMQKHFIAGLTMGSTKG